MVRSWQVLVFSVEFYFLESGWASGYFLTVINICKTPRRRAARWLTIKDTRNHYASTCPPLFLSLFHLAPLRSSTEESLCDPHWTVPQFSFFLFFILRLHGNTVPVTSSLDVCFSCSQNQRQEVMEGTRGQGIVTGWRIWRNEGGNNWKVSRMEARRRDLFCLVCQGPIKQRELLLRAVD